MLLLVEDRIPVTQLRACPELSWVVTMAELVRLLLVEDDERDAELVCMELERAGLELRASRVDNERDLMLKLAEGAWDIVISDFAMPSFDGLSAFRILHHHRPEVPFIFVSGVLGEERAVEAMRAGARDYVLKDNLARLGVAVRRELAASRVRQSEKLLELHAREDQRRLEMAVEASGAGIFEYLPERQKLPYVNPRLLEILGLDQDEAYGRSGFPERALALVHPDDRRRLVEAANSFLAGQTQRFSTEARLRHGSGSWVEVAIYSKAVARDNLARAIHVLGVVVDISERRELEVQLRQAQKMEAVGRLAGGVAHDFNNLLTAIFSFGEFAQRHLLPDTPAHRDIGEVLNAAKRAQVLTGQLLTFSRRKRIAPRIVNLNELIEGLERMLGRLVGEDVIVELRLAQELANVRIDPGSFEQVIVNLAVNARDAMPHGGRLIIETAETWLEDSSPDPASISLDRKRVSVRVIDEGVGMDDETISRVFEPFFTTKAVGIGTGLGLSTCYGIVRQAGGTISVESSHGHGTTFRILLPTTEDTSSIIDQPSPVSKRGGRETILVVEDEDQLRRLSVRILEDLGYTVYEAKNGLEALRIAKTRIDQLDLLLTDVVMPELGGKLLAERLFAEKPTLKVVFMSGYDPDQVAQRGPDVPGHEVLEKPFTPDTLGASVRRALDSD